MRHWATSSTHATRRQTKGHPGLQRAQMGDQSKCTGLGGEARTPARYALLAPRISGDEADAHIHNSCRAFSSCNKLHALACLLAQPATGRSWRECTNSRHVFAVPCPVVPALAGAAAATQWPLDPIWLSPNPKQTRRLVSYRQLQVQHAPIQKGYAVKLIGTPNHILV